MPNDLTKTYIPIGVACVVTAGILTVGGPLIKQWGAMEAKDDAVVRQLETLNGGVDDLSGVFEDFVRRTENWQIRFEERQTVMEKSISDLRESHKAFSERLRAIEVRKEVEDATP